MNLIICADGTANQPETKGTEITASNVLRLSRGIRKNTDANSRSQVFYDWGLGTDGGGLVSRLTGRGLGKNVLDAYRYIVQNYRAGDRIWLFGFSRGAYTMRVLAGLIYIIGVIRAEKADFIPIGWDRYCNGNVDEQRRFRDGFSHSENDIYFMGLWDTVAALKFTYEANCFSSIKPLPNVRYIRHALALDERRKDFVPILFDKPWPKETNVKQMWFRGVHADVGGGYPMSNNDNGYESDISLRWMMVEAGKYGLLFDDWLWHRLTDGGSLHDSFQGFYRFRGQFDRTDTIKKSLRDGIAVLADGVEI